MKKFLFLITFISAMISGSTIAATTKMDPQFLDKMIIHHQDGIKMAKMATDRAQTPEIKSMAEKILKDQSKEVDQMKKWRQEQFASTPKTNDMPKKMDMSKLENAKGKEFDQTFAHMMSEHHSEGIKMMEKALPELKNEQIKEFAQTAERNQKTELKNLESLQSSLH